MKALLRIGTVLVIFSGVPIVQMVREIAFWERGDATYIEAALVELPIHFAGHVISIADTLPHLNNHSESAQPGLAYVLVNGVPVLPPRLAKIRTGRSDLGRYHLWIDAWKFRDRRSGREMLLIGRRLGEPGARASSFDLLKITPDGQHIRTVTRRQRTQSYPVFRTLNGLDDSTVAAYPLSLMNFYPTVIVPIIFPWVSFVCGVVMVLVGRRRRRRSTSIPDAA